MKLTQQIARITHTILEEIMSGSEVTGGTRIRLFGGEEWARIMIDSYGNTVILYYKHSPEDIIISMNVMPQEQERFAFVSYSSTTDEMHGSCIRTYHTEHKEKIPNGRASLKSLKRMLSIACSITPGDGMINVKDIEADIEYMKAEPLTVAWRKGEEGAS